MFKTTNEFIAFHWARNERATNHNNSLHTDGDKLFSYALEIGYTENGKKILKDYTSGTALGFRSMTTSKHVGSARLSADLITDGVTLNEV